MDISCQGEKEMKAKLLRVLRLFGFDVLLLGLLEKLYLGLSKKLSALEKAVNFLRQTIAESEN